MEKQIIKDMKLVRGYCKLGHKLRISLKIPVSYPLIEVQFNGEKKENLLFKDYYELIRQELNCYYINPFFVFGKDEEWVTEKNEKLGIELALRVDKTEKQDKEYEENRERRKVMQDRKNKGIWIK